MKNLYILCPLTAAQQTAVRQAAGNHYTCQFRQDLTKSQAAQALATAHVILGEPSLAKLSQAKNLEWLQMTWAGADRYTQAPGFPKNVALTTSSGAYGNVISEYILSQLLAIYRQNYQYSQQQANQLWQELPTASLEGNTALILGTGDIGTATAAKLEAFGVTTWGISRGGAPRPHFQSVHPLSSLDSLLPQADILIACLPNTAETQGLLTAPRLLSMKLTATLINVGRGTLLPLADLEIALNAGQFRGVALDVLEEEPLPPTHPLWRHPRMIITPHIAGIGFGHAAQTEEKILKIFQENLENFATQKPLRNQIVFHLGYAP